MNLEKGRGRKAKTDKMLQLSGNTITHTWGASRRTHEAALTYKIGKRFAKKR